MSKTAVFSWDTNPTTDNVTNYTLKRGTVSGTYTTSIDMGLGATTANPAALPTATAAQTPPTTAYNALNVPGRAAGSTYTEPTSGVTVYKITSSSFPVASVAGFHHDYADGGHEVSLPHTGTTRTILVRDRSTLLWWLIDFTPGTGVSNARQLPSNLAPPRDQSFTFSNNPATPFYAWVVTVDAPTQLATIRRFNFVTMTEAPGGGWPRQDAIASSGEWPIWLQQTENDAFFCWMRGPNGNTVVGYDPSTATLKARTVPGCNEPHLDRAGRYIGVSMTTPPNGMTVWDWQTDTITWTLPGDPGLPFAHMAVLRRRWVGVEYNAGTKFWTIDPSVVGSNQVLNSQGSSSGVPEHVSGGWVQSQVAYDDQWALNNFYGAIQPGAGAWLLPGGMLFMTPNGQRRAVGHAFNSSIDILQLAYAKPSPDGRYIQFASNMNGQSRTDVFLVEMPTFLTGVDVINTSGTYFWAMTAQNAFGISAPSNEVTATITIDEPPPIPAQHISIRAFIS